MQHAKEGSAITSILTLVELLQFWLRDLLMHIYSVDMYSLHHLNPCMRLCYTCACLTFLISVYDLIRQLSAWTVIIATMHTGLVATGNVDIEACCLITQQAWHALSQ